MPLRQSDESIASAIKFDVEKSSTGSKRLKLRTLLTKFGYEKDQTLILQKLQNC